MKQLDFSIIQTKHIPELCHFYLHPLKNHLVTQNKAAIYFLSFDNT